MKYSVQVIGALILVVINDAYSRPNAGYHYNNALRPQIQRKINVKTDENYFHYDGVQVPVMYVHDSWPKVPSGDLSFGDKVPVHSAPFLRPPKPEQFSIRREDEAISNKKETDRIISKLQHLANLKYNTQLEETRSNLISDKQVSKRMKSSDRRSKPSKVITAIKENIIKEVEADVKSEGVPTSPAHLKEKYAENILKPKRVVQQRIVYSPLDSFSSGIHSKSSTLPIGNGAYAIDQDYVRAPTVMNFPQLRDEPMNPIRSPNQLERVYDLPKFVNLDNLAVPNSFPDQYYIPPRAQNSFESSSPFWSKIFPGVNRGAHPFLESFSTAVEYGPDSDGCRQRDNQKVETLNRVRRASTHELDDSDRVSAVLLPGQKLDEPELKTNENGNEDAREKREHDVTNFTVIIISEENKDEGNSNRADRKIDNDSDAAGVIKNELLHYKDTYKDSNSPSSVLKGPLSFFTQSPTKQGQAQGQLPQTRSGSDGPQISTLKVRKGGVAIAGPGGIATAGSGGTAIVGPGGTAYTTADGMAVVGSGGKVVSVGQNQNQGHSQSQGQSQGQSESGPQMPQYQIQYQPQISPYSVFPEFMHNRPNLDYRPGLVRVNRRAKLDNDSFSEDESGLDQLPFELIYDLKPERYQNS